MKLWLLTQDTHTGYDTYDSMVVAAETDEEARQIHPDGKKGWSTRWGGTWADEPSQVTAVCIGTAEEDQMPGEVICASFNAG